MPTYARCHDVHANVSVAPCAFATTLSFEMQNADGKLFDWKRIYCIWNERRRRRRITIISIHERTIGLMQLDAMCRMCTYLSRCDIRKICFPVGHWMKKRGEIGPAYGCRSCVCVCVSVIVQIKNQHDYSIQFILITIDWTCTLHGPHHTIIHVLCLPLSSMRMSAERFCTWRVRLRACSHSLSEQHPSLSQRWARSKIWKV